MLPDPMIAALTFLFVMRAPFTSHEADRASADTFATQAHHVARDHRLERHERAREDDVARLELDAELAERVREPGDARERRAEGRRSEAFTQELSVLLDRHLERREIELPRIR